MSSQTFFPIYFSVCLSSQCPGILLLYGHRYAEIWENVTFFFPNSCSFFFSEWTSLCITHSRVSLTRLIIYIYHKKMLHITVIWFQDLLLKCCRVQKWHKTKTSFIWHFWDSLLKPSSSLTASIQGSLRSKIEELISHRGIKNGPILS